VQQFIDSASADGDDDDDDGTEEVMC